MKKLALILSTSLFLISNLSATRYLVCNGGKAAIIDTNPPNGQGTSFSWAGGCCCGNWITTLDVVAPTGNPNIHVPEVSSNVYTALNTPPTNPNAPFTDSDKATMLAAIQAGGATEAWVNPIKLTTAAYALTYSGTTYLPLFYVNTSINISTHGNDLTLYSDQDRNITVTYKSLDLTVLSSANLSVAKGYSSNTLNTASLTNGTYIITVSAGGYAVNLSLTVSH